MNLFYFLKIKRKKEFFLTFFTFIFLISFFFFGFKKEKGFEFEKAISASNHNVFGWARANVPQGSENLGFGWISFNCENSPLPSPRCSQSNYGVHICTDETDYLCDSLSAPKTGKMIGYAYFDINDPNTAENEISWIRLDPPGPYPANPNYSAKLDLTTKKITGWARACNVFQSGCEGALKPDNERGGWDGWILLGPIVQSETDYGLWLDTSSNPAEFRGWAWGSDLMGWILFNCKDSTNPNACNQTKTSGTGTPLDQGFKVWTTFGLNQPPQKPSNLQENFGGCYYQGKPVFSWNYSDPESDPQEGFELELYLNTSPPQLIFNSCAMSDNTCDGHSQQSYVSPENLLWGQSYFWKVRVKDNQNNWSSWSDIKSFTTPSHAYPSPDFSWVPFYPFAGEIVYFIDKSKCYDSSNQEVACKNQPGISYLWEVRNSFGSLIFSSTQKDFQYIFPSTGAFTVKLTITDNNIVPVLSCSTSPKLINSFSSPPSWIER